MNKAFELILERLEELHERYINQYGAVGGNPMAFSVKECMEIVQEVAEEYNNGWISCSERLPELETQVLICTRERGMAIASLTKPDIFWEDEEGNILDEVIAWQPLPEPYKE